MSADFIHPNVSLEKKYNSNTRYGKIMIAEQKKLREKMNANAAAMPQESDADIEERIGQRFNILDYLVGESIRGHVRALIVSGPPGLGKSYNIEKALEEWDPEEINHRIVKGFARATGLYKILYQYKEEGQVLIFDDCDSIFHDDVALSMLKAVCDTTETRRVSYLSEADLRDEDGESIPKNFVFNGTIIFITNEDFDGVIESGSKLAPHMAAMVSRAHYVDLAMKSRHDFVVRIKQVIKQGLLTSKGLNAIQVQDVTDFIEEFSSSLRDLSLRTALKIADVRSGNRSDWRDIAKVTICKNEAA